MKQLKKIYTHLTINFFFQFEDKGKFNGPYARQIFEQVFRSLPIIRTTQPHLQLIVSFIPFNFLLTLLVKQKKCFQL